MRLRKQQKILAYDNEPRTLSNERYVILAGWPFYSPGYIPGAIVRRISGIDGSKIPGYHFNPNYYTVCREGAERAEFIGIEKNFLAKLA